MSSYKSKFTGQEIDDAIDSIATKVDLESAQDIEITDSDKGVILTSPDASRWRITIDDLGELVITKILED